MATRYICDQCDQQIPHMAIVYPDSGHVSCLDCLKLAHDDADDDADDDTLLQAELAQVQNAPWLN